MNVDELKRKIDKCISKVQKKGWSIQPGIWSSPKDKCCCPLGAIIIDNDGEFCRSSFFYASDLLFSIAGLLNDEVYSFTDGYDGQPYNRNTHLYEFWKLGKDYYTKYPRVKNDGDL